MHYAPIYYKGTCKPDPVPTPTREISSDGHVREWTLPQYMHQAYDRRHLHALRCGCGALATCIGAFDILTTGGVAISGGLWLCDECATQVDAGVKIRLL